MAIEATFTATDGEFPLAAVFSEFPAAEIELDRVVPTNEFIIPYFWVRGVEIDDISMENVTHPGIHDIRVVDDVNGAAFISCWQCDLLYLGWNVQIGVPGSIDSDSYINPGHIANYCYSYRLGVSVRERLDRNYQNRR